MKNAITTKKPSCSTTIGKTTNVNPTQSPKKSSTVLTKNTDTATTKLHPKRQLFKADNSIETLQQQLVAALHRAELAERETAKLQMELHKARTAYRDLERLHQVQTDILYAMRDGEMV